MRILGGQGKTSTFYAFRSLVQDHPISQLYGSAADMFGRGSDYGNIWTFFLFGSGPNAGNGPERVYGFDEGVDTVVFPDGFEDPLLQSVLHFPGPVGVRIIQLQPYRYIDVFVQEMEPNLLTNVPTGRVFFKNDLFI